MMYMQAGNVSPCLLFCVQVFARFLGIYRIKQLILFIKTSKMEYLRKHKTHLKEAAKTEQDQGRI